VRRANRQKRQRQALRCGAGCAKRGEMSDDTLARAVEISHAGTVRLTAHLPWVDYREEADVIRSFSGDTWPPNAVAFARFQTETVERRVQEILDVHLKAKVACNWVIGPATEPLDLGQILRAQGFNCMIHCAGMACDLARLPAEPALPMDIVVRLVDEPPSLKPATTQRRRNRLVGRQLWARLRPRQVWNFCAFHEARPVGETMLLVSDDIAGIYGVEVLESLRGRGIGTALVWAALHEAARQGRAFAVLSATGMGVGIYQRLGFREVGKLSFWKYGKMRQLRRRLEVRWETDK
jgi:GNAT superfamily N-acetyltransferase